MGDEEFDGLVADIAAHGLREPIMLLDGKIIDGRNRYRACIKSNTPVDVAYYRPLTDGDPLEYVLSKNLHRRHLSESQRAMVGASLPVRKPGRPKNEPEQGDLPEKSKKEITTLLNVGERSIESAKRVIAHGTPELTEAVRSGHISVSSAERASTLDPEKQAEVVRRAVAGEENAARTVIKQGVRENKEAALATAQLALPEARFGVVVADPAWEFEVWNKDTGGDRGAANHYAVSDLERIAELPVQNIAADDCVLFLWATSPMLPQALEVMRRWGFWYKSQIVWCKRTQGTGYWFRSMHEHLLVGTRGKPPAPAPGTQWPSAIGDQPDDPLLAHSEKPEWSYQMIEQYFPNLPKIELNARKTRAGWTAWGAEAPQTASLSPTGALGGVDGQNPTEEAVEPQSEQAGGAGAPGGFDGDIAEEPDDESVFHEPEDEVEG